jgi:TetR/AcrR family fatty acid metabolism transcriptional regulator
MPKVKDDFKKKKIIEAAIKVISEKGFFKSTISTIAYGAEVADGTIYTYFRNKEDLLIQSFEYVLDIILDGIYKELKKENDYLKKIKIIITGHLNFMEQHPDLANFLQIQLRQSKREIRLKIREIMRKYYKIIGKILSEAISQGIVRDDVNLRIIGHMIFGTVDEIVTSWVLAENRCSLTDKADEIYKLIISAIKKR